MRLSQEHVQAIARCTREAFGERAIVRLFGSRVDDLKGAATSTCIWKFPICRIGLKRNPRFNMVFTVHWVTERSTSSFTAKVNRCCRSIELR